MKKLFVLAALFLAFVFVGAFVGCEDKPSSTEEHTHTVAKTEAKAPSCTEEGYAAYYSCTECGKLFSDANATVEISVIPTLEKLAHSYTNENATSAYLASEATCTAKAMYYKSCICGEKGLETFFYGDFEMHEYSEEVATQAYLVSEATCEAKATYYKSCVCGGKGTETFTHGEFGNHVYNEELPTQAYLVSAATCEAKATYYKSCACGERGTDTFEYGDFGGHGKNNLILNENALVSQTADTYYLSCPYCGELSTETTTVAEFLGLENGMCFTQFQGFNVELPKNTTLTIEKYTVKLTDGTVKAEYTGGSMDDFNTSFNALSPKFVYLLEYAVSNGDDTDVYEGVVDFSINTVDTVSIAQTESGVDNLHAKGSSAELFYVEGNFGGRKGAYEWTSGTTTSGTNKTTITLIKNSLTQNNALAGRYLYFDFYATRDFAPVFTHNGDTYYLYSKTYDNVRMFNSQGNLITTRSQSLWNNKWVTIEICLEVNYEFDNNWRGFMTASATGNYGLVNTDDEHIYLDNFRISTYSIYGEIEGVNECVTHTFNAKVPQPKYLSQDATCQQAATFVVSCSVCGAKGSDTFHAGGVGEHEWTENPTNEYLAKNATCITPATYYYSCSVCEYKHTETFSHGMVSAHAYVKEVVAQKYLASEATATQNATYYKSCVCGKKGTETFEYDLTLPDSIEVTVNPTKTAYVSGEKFDISGMVVMAYLRNGDEVIVNDYVLSHTVLTYPIESVIITYKGVETEVPVTVYEFSVADVIVEIANAYDRQGGQIHYDQTKSRRHLTVSPEEATSQKTIYLDCSSFVNSIYREAFGVNIIPFIPNNLGSLPDGSWSPQTGNYNTYAKNYTDNVDVMGYWENANYTTAAAQAELLAEVKAMLQVGDVLNYRHHRASGDAGHVYIYLGDNLFMHCYAGGSFHYNSTDPSLSWEEYKQEENNGMIDTISVDDLFTDTANYRYLFKNTTADKVTSFALFRPLARGLTVTEKAINRMKIAGLTLEKTSSVGVNSAVRTGDTITYTIMLVNKVSKKHTGVTISDLLPEGTTYVANSGSTGVTVDGRNLTWSGDVGASATVSVSYTVKVTQTTAGALIVSDSTYVSGIKLGKIVQSVSGYTQAQESALVEKANAYVTSSKTFTSSIEFATTLYSEALGITLFNYATVEAALADLLDTDNLTCKTTTDISKMIAPSLYGGLDIVSGQLRLEDSERTRLVSEAELAVGDIIITSWGGGNRVYVYLGNSKLVCCESGDLTCKELTIGTDIYGDSRKTNGVVNDDDVDNILVALIAYDGFAVLRPSMVG